MTFCSWIPNTEERWKVHLTNRREKKKIKWKRTFCRRRHRQFFHLFGYLSPQTLLWFSTFSCFVSCNIKSPFFDEFFFFFLLILLFSLRNHSLSKLWVICWFEQILLWYFFFHVGWYWVLVMVYSMIYVLFPKESNYWLIGQKKAKVCWNSSNYIKDWRHDNA